MTDKQFIEKAIEGGWLYSQKQFEEMKKPWGPQPGRERQIDTAIQIHLKEDGIHKILLDPNAWKAVGKVEGWSTFSDGNKWEYKVHTFMLLMIDYLWEGKTIKQFLETL